MQHQCAQKFNLTLPVLIWDFDWLNPSQIGISSCPSKNWTISKLFNPASSFCDWCLSVTFTITQFQWVVQLWSVCNYRVAAFMYASASKLEWISDSSNHSTRRRSLITKLFDWCSTKRQLDPELSNNLFSQW